jgi:ribosomal protein L12E/L44/L45/RPP1/RPP2
MLMSVDERISTLAEDAAEHPSAPGAYGHSGGEILVGLDAREILRDVADHTFVGRVRIETEEGDLKFAFEVAPMKYVRSPDNEARRLYADNEPAEELSVRSLVQALSETGALTLEEVTTRTESSETAGEPAEPPAATDPAATDPAATDPAASEPAAEESEEMSEDIQEIQSGLSELTSALEDL